MRKTRAGVGSRAADEEHIGKTLVAKNKIGMDDWKECDVTGGRAWKNGSQRYGNAKRRSYLQVSLSSTDVRDIELSPSVPLHAAQ